mmetsp:Transcript_60347/g.141027  ORF Transcript_60347/g.141027 Transcript_60347/m.141027 type:complete len:179 (-) Transcript_60347:73-609(-)
MVAEEESTTAAGEAEAIPVGETVPPAQPPPEEAGLSHAISLAMREQYLPDCSIYVGGLEGEDEIWPEQLYEHFKECGEVKRVCIKIDKASGERLGHAYVDFAEESQAEIAKALDGSEFCGRTIKVDKKKSMKGKGDENGKGWGGMWGMMGKKGGKDMGKGWWGGWWGGGKGWKGWGPY